MRRLSEGGLFEGGDTVWIPLWIDLEQKRYLKSQNYPEGLVSWRNISATSASILFRGLKQGETDERPSAFIISRCLEPLMKYKHDWVVDKTFQTRIKIQCSKAVIFPV